MMKRLYLIYLFLGLLFFAFVYLGLHSGSTGWLNFSLLNLLQESSIGSSLYLVQEVRLPAVLMSSLSGMALGLSGLVLQVIFRNQLAGPGVLGVSSGGALFASFGILAGLDHYFSLGLLSILGSLTVLGLILLASLRFQSNSSLLILGLMLGFIVSSIIAILQYRAEMEDLQGFVIWTMGTYQGQGLDAVIAPVVLLVLGILGIALAHGKLDKLLLGYELAQQLNLKIKRKRLYFLLMSGVLTGLVTAYCGPLAFTGIAAPHIARMVVPSDVNSQLIPLTLLFGGLIGLISLCITHAPFVHGGLPLNAVLSLFGVPVVIWLVIKRPYSMGS